MEWQGWLWGGSGTGASALRGPGAEKASLSVGAPAIEEVQALGNPWLLEARLLVQLKLRADCGGL